MKIPVLMYHRIEETGSGDDPRYAVSPGMFRKQMNYLKREGYTPIKLDILTSGESLSVPVPKPVVITFDDGYLDNYQNAFPVLCDHNFPATVFVISDLVGENSRWMTGRKGSEKPLMGWREIGEMNRFGITIGSHTMTHCRLSQLTPDEAELEIAGSKRVLEERLGFQIDHFAYPYGDFNESVVEMVERAGYKTACSTRTGFNRRGENRFLLRRLEVFGSDSLVNFSIKVTYGTNDGSMRLPMSYFMKRIIGK